MPNADRARRGRTADRALAALLLAGATVAAFWPVLSAGFVLFDDERYVAANPRVQEGFTAGAVRWAFTTGHASNWHPVTWLSHILDWSLFGAAPAGHHLTSLLLHALNAVLLLLLLDRMTGETARSLFAAALFALHPLHVESVAWVAERKDVLSALFGLLAAFAYLRFLEDRRPRRYLLLVALFALGLMAKPMLVTLPLVFLLLDVWPLRRLESAGASWRGLVVEKLPLLALAAVSSAVTLAVQASGPALGSASEFPLLARLGNAAVSYVAYLGRTLWPTGLSVFYPHPGASLSLAAAAAATAALALATGTCWALRKRHPYLLTGWLVYLVTLVPVIGLVQVGAQARADRYTYLPLVGIFVAVAWGAPDAIRALSRRSPRVPLAVAALAVLAALGARTWVQAGTWKDSIALFGHAVAVDPGNALAHRNLGTALTRAGRADEAFEHFAEAARLAPDDAECQYNFGVALAARGRTADAAERYAAALQRNPGHAEAHNNLGILLAGQGRLDEAEKHLEAAARIRPTFAAAHLNLASVLILEGRIDEARREAEVARGLGLEIPPELARSLGLGAAAQPPPLP